MLYEVLIAEDANAFTEQYAGIGCLEADDVTEDELQEILWLSRRFRFVLQITPKDTDSCEGDEQNGNG